MAISRHFGLWQTNLFSFCHQSCNRTEKHGAARRLSFPRPTALTEQHICASRVLKKIIQEINKSLLWVISSESSSDRRHCAGEPVRDPGEGDEVSGVDVKLLGSGGGDWCIFPAEALDHRRSAEAFRPHSCCCCCCTLNPRRMLSYIIQSDRLRRPWLVEMSHKVKVTNFFVVFLFAADESRCWGWRAGRGGALSAVLFTWHTHIWNLAGVLEHSQGSCETNSFIIIFFSTNLTGGDDFWGSWNKGWQPARLQSWN